MWSERRRFTALLVSALGLQACGFRPLHGEREGSRAYDDLAFVRIAGIPSRTGQLVRNELLELLNPRGLSVDQVFVLETALDEVKEGLAIQPDDSVTRFNLRLIGQFSLRDLRVNRAVLQGRTQAIAAYNVVQSDYANLIAEKDARSRAARNVAQSIATRVSIYFARLREGSDTASG